MRWEELDQQPCSLARTLSVVGDRWTLLVLRESFLGIRRFDEFEQRLGITRHVLADRLKKLVEAALLAKVAYQQRPLREEYRLTDKGRDLYPAVLALVNWGDRHMSGAEGAPIRHVHRRCGQPMHGVLVCSECGEPLAPRDVLLEEAPALKGQLLPAHWHVRQAGEKP
jgi:DNA-binding HxlR family transcriptional regulator